MMQSDIWTQIDSRIHDLYHHILRSLNSTENSSFEEKGVEHNGSS